MKGMLNVLKFEKLNSLIIFISNIYKMDFIRKWMDGWITSDWCYNNLFSTYQQLHS